jgi:hypothetical protein
MLRCRSISLLKTPGMLRYLILIFIIGISNLGFSQKDLELARLALENKYGLVGEIDPATLIATTYLDQKMGYVDVDGKQILPLGSYSTCQFGDGVGIYYSYDPETQKYTHHAIDKNGKLLKTFKGFYFLQRFDRGLAIVKKEKSNYGLMTFDGTMKVKPIYNSLKRLNSKWFQAADSTGKYGIIDVDGKLIAHHKFGMVLHIDTVSRKIWAYNFDLKNYGIFDFAGKLLKDFPWKNVKIESYSLYGQPYRCHDGLIILKENETDRLAVINLDFEIVVPFGGKYLDILDINDGRIKVATDWESEKLNERVTRSYIAACGFLDYSGNVVIPPEKRSAHYFNDGLCAVANSNYCGYMDKDGNTAIPFRYKDCSTFHKGYAKVKLDGQYFIINKAGEIVLNSRE